jgi:DNA mismatch repair protein MutL
MSAFARKKGIAPLQESLSFEPAPPSPDKPPLFSALEPVGQVLATYLVLEGPGRMVLIDQHAAHERLAFERMRRQHQTGRVEAQALLVPRTLELSTMQAQVASAEAARLLELGFELEPFGGATWALKAAPTALRDADAARVVLDVLDELAEVGQTTPAAEALEALLSCAACHTVVRAGDLLSKDEIRALLAQMDEIDFSAHCPHGRPVYVEWSARELARLFHRT